uniref:cyclin-T1-3-like n=1 Tax=Fragaria vesca subsp. vesca TaxID=101020 RepID=UPI0005CA20E3|nr:PREDICTED: cyclin-T1-3-like [Fragaria vesca subsp. vesca]
MVEETPWPLKDVILVSYEIIHKKDPAAAQRIRQKEVYELQKELILTSERVVLGTLAFYFNVHHPYKLLVEAIKKFKVAQNALAAKTKSRTEQQDLDHGSSDNIQASYEATSNSHLQAGCTISGTSRSASSPASEQSYVENDGPARSAGMTGALDQNLEVKDNQQSKVAEAQTLSKSVSEGRSEEGQVRESNDRKGEIREGGDKHLGRNLDNTHSALGRSPQEAIKKVNKDKVRAALENCEGKPLLM